MATAHALKLCPHLVLVRGRMDKYREASDIVFNIFHEYTPLVEGLSLDEAYLDVTDCDLFNNSATLIAQDIRKKIFERTNGLTASAGIAPNKLLAKIASDYNKPNGQFTISPSEVDEFIKNIPIEKIHGVGKVTAKHMHDIGIKTCLDMQQFSRSDMIYHFGKFGDALYDYCRGIDERDVETEHERKSLGTEETFPEDISSLDKMREHVIRMAQEVKDSLSHYEDRTIKNLFVKIKYFDFKVTTIERAMPFSIENFLYLLEERWPQDPRAVRLLGVGVKFEETSEISQLPLFDGIKSIR